ncbi:MAG: hypothetical protein WCA35_22200, partial [Kovacikia sp.]
KNKSSPENSTPRSRKGTASTSKLKKSVNALFSWIQFMGGAIAATNHCRGGSIILPDDNGIWVAVHQIEPWNTLHGSYDGGKFAPT